MIVTVSVETRDDLEVSSVLPLITALACQAGDHTLTVEASVAEASYWRRQNRVSTRRLSATVLARWNIHDRASRDVACEAAMRWAMGQSADRYVLSPAAWLATRELPVVSGWCCRGPVDRPYWLLSLTTAELLQARELALSGLAPWSLAREMELPPIPWPGIVLDWSRAVSASDGRWDEEDVEGYRQLRQNPVWLSHYPLFDEDVRILLETMDRKLR
jgi:hypothetical protein